MKNHINEIIRYIIAGIINTIVGYAIFIFLVYLIQINPFYSNGISYIFALCVAFILNKYFVFNSINRDVKHVIKFIISFIISFLINIFILFVCLNVLGQNPAMAQILAMIFYSISFYVLNKFFVFNELKEIKK